MHCHTQDAIGQAGIKISLPPPAGPKHLDVQVKSECEGSKTESGTFYVYSEINASVYRPYNQIFIADRVF